MRMPCNAAAIGLSLVLTCALASPQAKLTKPPHRPSTPAPASPNTRLLKATLRQDTDAVRALIAKGADPNARDATVFHRPALAVAASLANEPIVRLLLDHGAKLTGAGHPCTVPLQAAMDAAASGKASKAVGVIRVLLDHGADPSVTWGGMTTGEAAISDHLPDVLALLLEHGVKPNAMNRFQTLLAFAVDCDDLSAVRMLLAAGADPNAEDMNGDSLCAAANDQGIKQALAASGGRDVAFELPPEIDLSTPQNAIGSFAKAINRADMRAMAICIWEACPQAPLVRVQWLARALERDRIHVRFTVSDLNEQGDTATCTVETHPMTREGSDIRLRVRLREPVEFVRERGRWRIQPYDNRNDNPEGFVGFVNELAEDYYVWAQDLPATGRRLSPNELMDAIECRVRLGILARQVLEHARAHGGALAITNRNMLHNVIGTYDPAIVGRCAARGVAPMSFQFNDKLTNVKLSAIREPSRTVLLYEGSGGKPQPRHGGHVMTAFADGVCFLIDPEMLAAQKWKAK